MRSSPQAEMRRCTQTSNKLEATFYSKPQNVATLLPFFLNDLHSSNSD